VRILFLIITFLIPAITISQNWQLLNPSYRYNYQTDTSAFISNTILVDSVTVESGDSVFHLNRIARPVVYQWGDSYAITNLPQFLQRRSIKKANGFYHFSDTLSFCINPYLGLNDTWLFDTTNNITGTIVQIENGNVLGIPDSLKTILLSSGDTIILSKTYGIVRFPNGLGQSHYYELKGVEGPDIGIKVPGFWEFFDFNVGDEFQYWGGTWVIYSSDTYTKKIRIISKEIFPNAIRYEAEMFLWGYYQDTWHQPHQYEWYNEHGFIQLEFNNVPNELYNVCNNQMASIESYGVSSHYTVSSSSCISDSQEAFVIQMYKNDQNGLYKSCYPASYLYNDTSVFYYYCPPEMMEIEFRPGLGKTKNSIQGFESWQQENLEGYIIDGDTVGTISSIEELEQKYSRLAYIVYPNPTSDMLYIKTVEQYFSAEIVDISGREVKSTKNEKEINIVDLNPGLYAIRIHTSKGVVTRKFVKE
jgi:hypothetical protein